MVGCRICWNAWTWNIKIATRKSPACKKLPSEHLKSGRIFVHCELEDRGIPQIADLLRYDILFCATDFPHEPRPEFRENIEKVHGARGCPRRDQTKNGVPKI